MDTVSLRYIVDDVDVAADFYVEHLGFEVQMKPGRGFAMLSQGNLRLFLNEPGAGGAGQPVDGQSPAPGGWNRFQLVRTDLDAAVTQLRQAGVEFRSPIIEGRGGRQILVADPAGNLVELFEPANR